jgi:uncharacterized membrane protein YcaP (DUF421 family)
MEQFFLVTGKSILIFVLLAVAAQFIGRKHLAQLSYFDMVIAVTLAVLAGVFLIQGSNGLWLLYSFVLLAVLELTYHDLTFKNLRFRKIAEGEPAIVIQNGKILEQNMQRLRYDMDHLETQLRDKGIFDLCEVEFAVLEPSGQLSVLKKSQNQPITPLDLKVDTVYKGLSTELIKDGEVMEDHLTQNHLSREWLDDQLKAQQITSISDVYFAALNTNGILYISLKSSPFLHIQQATT